MTQTTQVAHQTQPPTETLWEFGPIKVTKDVSRWGGRSCYHLYVNGRLTSSSYPYPDTGKLRGTPVAFARQRIKDKIKRLDYHVRKLEAMKREQDELKEALELIK